MIEPIEGVDLLTSLNDLWVFSTQTGVSIRDLQDNTRQKISELDKVVSRELTGKGSATTPVTERITFIEKNWTSATEANGLKENIKANRAEIQKLIKDIERVKTGRSRSFSPHNVNDHVSVTARVTALEEKVTNQNVLIRSIEMEAHKKQKQEAAETPSSSSTVPPILPEEKGNTLITIGGKGMPTVEDIRVDPERGAHYLAASTAYLHLKEALQKNESLITRKIEDVTERVNTLLDLKSYLKTTQLKACEGNISLLDTNLRSPTEVPHTPGDESISWTVFQKGFQKQVENCLKSYSEKFELKITLLENRMQSTLPYDLLWNHFSRDAMAGLQELSGSAGSVQNMYLPLPNQTVEQWSAQVNSQITLVMQAMIQHEKRTQDACAEITNTVISNERRFDEVKDYDQKQLALILEIQYKVGRIENEDDSMTMASRLSLVEHQITFIRDANEARKIEYKNVMEELLPNNQRELKKVRMVFNQQIEDLRKDLGIKFEELWNQVRETRAPHFLPE